ncbi:DNA mismatch repair endonuclease MutL [Thermospira aquatica]|uniref:DNA mismatch repair protein MutL n=1 Tax=Thermospira aquatica TaxID=2828656 RepID=A0AAX3BE38_9SPIR|nr:DNA mismatch repair endonuclease MutL [Thermospira aquatica]URA10375.1 DNA mismatch repair endonuclease MutL [Thermospira aquatica]
MGIIRPLDEATTTRIAAGEVIDRPASVVRELVDNALDAQATEIEVSIMDGGISSVEVSDNGIGMSREDVLLCYHNHTTSKISTFEDLEHLSTLGFRGEALASIASVAFLDVMSRPRESVCGTRIVVEYGELKDVQEIGMGYGTVVRVNQLFERLPARKKFLQSPMQEAKLVYRELLKKMIVFPECGFLYRSEGRERFRSPARRSTLERIVDLFGDITDELIPFEFAVNEGRVHGFLGRPTYLKPQKNFQFFAVNRRVVEWKLFSFVLSQVYGDLIPPQRHPLAFVFVEMDPSEVDVNVHPMKREVRFRREHDFQQALVHHLRQSLEKSLALGKSGFFFSSSPAAKEAFSVPFVHEKTETPILPDFLLTEDHPLPNPYEGESLPATETGLFSEENVEDVVSSYRFVGVLFATYLLFEKGEEIFIIDQHAAHERIRYEEIKAQYQTHSSSQELLHPVSLHLGREKTREVLMHKTELERLGFDVEEFGNDSVVLRAIPAYLSPSRAEEAFEVCLDALENHTQAHPSEMIEETLKQLACKTAIKAHDHISAREAYGLLERLSHTPNSSSCPHGRPTFLRLSKQDLEKLFKRTGF